MSDQPPSSGPDEQVGSVADEAAKLLGALTDWARDQGQAHVDSAEEVFRGLGAAAHSVNDHLATGGEDCRYCPVCLVIAQVRRTTPEVREHLALAASSLMQAAAGMLATQVPTDQRRSGPVERIDLDEEPRDEDGQGGGTAP